MEEKIKFQSEHSIAFNANEERNLVPRLENLAAKSECIPEQIRITIFINKRSIRYSWDIRKRYQKRIDS